MAFSKHSLALRYRLPNESLQTKNLHLPTCWAAMIGGIFARNDYVKMLPTPVAVNQHCDWVLEGHDDDVRVSIIGQLVGAAAVA